VGVCSDRKNETVDRLMIEHLLAFRPDLVGFNTVTPLIHDTLSCASLIRQHHKGLIIAGGHHATALPELTLERIPELDGVVAGEGEIIMTRLANGENPDTLPGVYWRQGDSLSGSAHELIKDLDSLPFPALDLLDMPFYCRKRGAIVRGKRLSTLSIITARGCYHRCPFCSESLTYGKGVRFHSVDYAVDLMRYMLSKYPVDAFYFHDNDFLADENRAAALCEAMIRSGFDKRMSFVIQARVDRLTPDILSLLKRAGCTMIELGIESFEQKNLDFIGKGVTVQQNEKALNLIEKTGISAHAYMMTGFPGETLEDLEQVLSRIKSIKGDVTFTLSPMTIDPGTRLYRDKGSSFFEINPWTRESVSAYYNQDPLSTLDRGSRKLWMNERGRPWLKSSRRRSFFRRNPFSSMFVLIYEKVMERVKGFVRPNIDHMPRY
jgi:radical SAM superfamily enzyme YgiQ (UPF0313 family)